ncbi:unnamed protein product [Caenorhabditis auriculariae]|uniref:Pseudouridylate synthase 1 homolog n=1 Tax=Caenorhabditis auriculariae TaxID=2777116 RepID=A0A8S1H8W8_9PELO|nr:unnamed protein product [Caenorhabditis auriculariae]
MTKTTETHESAAEQSLHHVHHGGIEKTKDETAKKKNRVKLGKYAMLLGYQGKKYFGMQIQKDMPTIEMHLLDAMLKLGWISPEQRANPFSIYFQRAARTDKAVSAARQMCGMQLPQRDDYYKLDGAADLNKILPEDIRVFGMRRATNWFHPQKQCDNRTYSYTTPTFVFAKPDQLTDSSFRITKEVVDEVNSILEIFLGTHNFFNYTAKRAYNDQSCNRYIISFKCGEPFLFKDPYREQEVEFITITIKGQSFVLHQIRKMIGMVITVIRELQLKSAIQKSFEGKRLDIPMAPGLGLLLERTHYDSYDRKHSATHEPLTFWGDIVEAEAERVKFELITKEMLETELLTQGMMKWLTDLNSHDYLADPEAEEPPSKTFVTMAVACANKALESEAMEAEEDVKAEPELEEAITTQPGEVEDFKAETTEQIKEEEAEKKSTAL